MRETDPKAQRARKKTWSFSNTLFLDVLIWRKKLKPPCLLANLRVNKDFLIFQSEVFRF